MTESTRPPVGARKAQGTLADLLEEQDESDLLLLEPRKAQAHKAQLALARLLGEQGVYCGQDDLVVKPLTSRAGRAFYVVIALNGTEAPVAEAIGPITRRSASPGFMACGSCARTNSTSSWQRRA